jgi:hypothetical protein
MTDEALGKTFGGSTRCAYDFTYEVAVVQRRFEARLVGRDPGPYPGADGWIQAPAEFRSKETAVREIKETTEAMLKAFDALPEAELERPIDIPSGQTTALEIMSIARSHLVYHDAQLNYIQASEGDSGMHWDD